jgi:hypothetical protein
MQRRNPMNLTMGGSVTYCVHTNQLFFRSREGKRLTEKKKVGDGTSIWYIELWCFISPPKEKATV